MPDGVAVRDEDQRRPPIGQQRVEPRQLGVGRGYRPGRLGDDRFQYVEIGRLEVVAACLAAHERPEYELLLELSREPTDFGSGKRLSRRQGVPRVQEQGAVTPQSTEQRSGARACRALQNAAHQHCRGRVSGEYQAVEVPHGGLDRHALGLVGRAGDGHPLGAGFPRAALLDDDS